MNVNLLSRPFQIRVELRSILRGWAFVWCLCLLATLPIIVGGYRDIQARRSALERVKIRSRPIQYLATSTAVLEAQLTEARRQNEWLGGVQPTSRTLRFLQAVARSTQLTGERLCVDEFIMNENLNAASPLAAGNQAPKEAPVQTGIARVNGSSVTLKGMAVDDESIARFVTEMRKSQTFSRVELLSVSGMPLPVRVAQSGTLKSGKRFDIACEE